MRTFDTMATLLVFLLTLSSATALRAQTDFSIKIYAIDGSGWTDSVTIGKFAAATGGITDSVNPAIVEKELPPLPPSGPGQTPDIRLVDPLGGDTYGQGINIDVRQLVNDGQKDVYRMNFRRDDPNGFGVTLSWDAGLDTVGGGGFYLTDGLGGLLFAPVNMATQTTFTFGEWSSLPGGFVDVVVGDGSKYRTFTSTQIATGTDQKGKFGKSEKPKPVSVDFGFDVPAVDGATTLFLAFDKVVEGTVSFENDSAGRLPIYISGLKAYPLELGLPPLDSTVVVHVTGKGFKGKLMKSKFGFGPAATKASTAVTEYEYQHLRLPSPNVNNIGGEIYFNPDNLSLGMGTGVGLSTPIGPNQVFHYIRIAKWKDVTKTLYKFKNVTILMGGPGGGDTSVPAYCLDTINSKANVKMLKSIGPDKMTRVKDSGIMGNRLVAEMIALKFNIAASRFGHTPATGFRDLVYTNPGHPFDGLTVDEIANRGDRALACFDTAGQPGLPAGWSYTMMATFLETLNGEFSGDWDTVSWSGVKTIATGVKAVALSGILTSAGPSNAPVAPVDYSSLYEVPAAFSLSQNYPNPFNPTTTIEFSIPEDAIVTLKVFDLLGRVVAILADREEFSSGENWVELDASNLATGVYYYRIVVNDGQFQDLGKMVLMR